MDPSGYRYYINPIQILLVVGLAPLNTSEKWMEPVKMKTGATLRVPFAHSSLWKWLI